MQSLETFRVQLDNGAAAVFPGMGQHIFCPTVDERGFAYAARSHNQAVVVEASLNYPGHPGKFFGPADQGRLKPSFKAFPAQVVVCDFSKIRHMYFLPNYELYTNIRRGQAG